MAVLAFPFSRLITFGDSDDGVGDDGVDDDGTVGKLFGIKFTMLSSLLTGDYNP